MGMWMTGRNAAALRRLSPEFFIGCRFSSMTALTSQRFICTDTNKTDEPFKVEEAETVNAPPPLSEKLLVLCGNGFVGSHVCKEALDHGLTVASLSRLFLLVERVSSAAGILKG